MSAWPDFSAFTLTETAYKALLRQAFFRKMKDDFDNLNGRVSQLEVGIPGIDHFTSIDDRFASFATTGIEDRAGRFVGYRDNSSGTNPALWSFPSNSVVRIASTQGGATSAKNVMVTIPRYVFNNVTRPLIYEARLKWRGQSTPPHIYGLSSDVPGIVAVPTFGIFLQFPDSSNMRFISRDSAQTTGTSFTRIAADTWFTVKIEFTDTPSNRALCSVDGVLKETFTTNLPTSRDLAGIIYTGSNASTATSETDCDKFKYAPVALADAA